MRRTYRVTSSTHPQPGPFTWASSTLANRRREGALADAEVPSLHAYLRHADTDDKPAFHWPDTQQGAAGVFITFDPPLVQFPLQMSGGSTLRFDSSVRVFGGVSGKRLADGTARRTVTCDGYESIEIDGLPYRDCVRLCIDTQVRIPWLARVRTTEYIWLAAGKGAVRRLQRLEGRVVFTRFTDVWEYVLIDCAPAEVEDTARTPLLKVGPDGVFAAETWSCAALYLSPFLPRPRLAGAIIEFGRSD
jgi:hypothetical protein